MLRILLVLVNIAFLMKKQKVNKGGLSDFPECRKAQGKTLLTMRWLHYK